MLPSSSASPNALLVPKLLIGATLAAFCPSVSVGKSRMSPPLRGSVTSTPPVVGKAMPIGPIPPEFAKPVANAERAKPPAWPAGVSVRLRSCRDSNASTSIGRPRRRHRFAAVTARGHVFSSFGRTRCERNLMTVPSLLELTLAAPTRWSTIPNSEPHQRPSGKRLFRGRARTRRQGVNRPIT